MGVPTVGLCMMVKDEEANIARCLESAKPYIDTWTILDTGSTDKTPVTTRARCIVASSSTSPSRALSSSRMRKALPIT